MSTSIRESKILKLLLFHHKCTPPPPSESRKSWGNHNRHDNLSINVVKTSLHKAQQICGGRGGRIQRSNAVGYSSLDCHIFSNRALSFNASERYTGCIFSKAVVKVLESEKHHRSQEMQNGPYKFDQYVTPFLCFQPKYSNPFTVSTGMTLLALYPAQTACWF